jgi:hypothetical protein
LGALVSHVFQAENGAMAFLHPICQRALLDHFQQVYRSHAQCTNAPQESEYPSNADDDSSSHPITSEIDVKLENLTLLSTYSSEVSERKPNRKNDNKNNSKPSSSKKDMRSLSKPPLTLEELIPEIITAKVLEVEKIRLNSSYKSRYSFLRHLPQYIEIELIEIDLKRLVSKEIYTKFHQEITKRVQKRLEKKKLENLETKQANERR